MEAEQRPFPTLARRKAVSWQWREAPVNETFDHFELRCGDASRGNWYEWILLALVGRAREGVINVQFLIDKGHPRGSKMAEDTVKELNFYVLELQEPDPWRYLQYHCVTMSNVYGTIHWSFMSGSASSAGPQKVYSLL